MSLRTDPARPVGLTRLAALSVALSLVLGAVGCENLETRQIGPTLTDDQPLSQAVRDALGAVPETMHQRIEVKTTTTGRVRLSGLVDTDATRIYAEQIAQRVPGVDAVINTILVRNY